MNEVEETLPKVERAQLTPWITAIFQKTASSFVVESNALVLPRGKLALLM